MNNNQPFVPIDPGNLSSVTGGWNPIKSAWNTAKQVGRKVVDATVSEVNYVKQHPEILYQAGRAPAI